MLAATAWGATLGKVVPIGGQASDIALDEQRGVLYIANFTANRIDVMSLADFSVQTSMNVSAQPGSCSLSPDGRYLLVSHYGNFESPASQNNALTVIDLETRGKQTFALGAPALGVAFGINNQALVATTQDFSLFDPVSGVSRLLATVPELAAQTLPAPPANFPPNIVAASMNVSGDLTRIYGLTDTFEFGLDTTNGRLSILGFTSSPPMGPRVVSVNQDGSKYLAGWVLHGSAIWDFTIGIWNLAQFPDAEGLLNVGSHALDSNRGLVYAQVTKELEEGEEASSAPILQVLRDDNLQVIERIQLPENLAGKSLLSSDGMTMYSISDSGVMILPVGDLNALPRILASENQVLFQSNFCERQVLSHQITLFDPSGRSSDFTLSSNSNAVEVTPTSGSTPATVIIRADPAAFALTKGTTEATVSVTSAGAVNLAKDIRVLINTPEPDQRGTSVSVEGDLVDILPDPFRERFFILRQDTN
ncbi:MAG: hypothetical protein GY953_31200, partial [bacterium]|nr:hypothetical protein [bacterium]